MREAINQLLRYSNQRRELLPTLYTENEGVERLFHTNQLLIASDFFEARAATIGAPPEAYLEWADTSPVPLSTVAEELGACRLRRGRREAAQRLAALGPEQTDRGGHAAVLPRAGAAPRGLRSGRASLHSQQILVAGMLRPAHLLDLIRNFTVFQQVDGKTRKVVARYQQFRAVHKAVARLQEGRTAAQGADRDERGGIIWHTQGSGKSLSMVFLVRKMRMTPAAQTLQGGGGHRPHRPGRPAPRDGAVSAAKPCAPAIATTRTRNRRRPAPSASWRRRRRISSLRCCRSIRT